MKELPDKTILLELLDLAKDAEQKAKELYEMGEKFNKKWGQRSRREIKTHTNKEDRAANFSRGSRDIS